MLLSFTVTWVMVPTIPTTLTIDGYGAPAPLSAMVTDPEFENVAVPKPEGSTVSTKASLAVRTPSLTVTVMIEVPA